MNTDRIERALREGPPDEPTYTPGSFRRAGYRRWSGAVGASMSVVLVAGIAIGVGLAALRDNVGVPQPRPLIAADLLGVWQSDEIELRDWVEMLRDKGFDQAAIDAFLEHDPYEDRVRYALRFVNDRIIIQAAYDDLPFQTLTEGKYLVLDGGVLDITEVGDSVERCRVSAAAAIDGGQLTTIALGFGSCDPDERMAMTIFFDLVPYERAGSE